MDKFIVPDYYSYLNVAPDASHEEILAAMMDRIDYTVDKIDLENRETVLENIRQAGAWLCDTQARHTYDMLREGLDPNKKINPLPVSWRKEKQNYLPDVRPMLGLPVFASYKQTLEAAHQRIDEYAKSLMTQEDKVELTQLILEGLHDLQHPPTRVNNLVRLYGLSYDAAQSRLDTAETKMAFHTSPQIPTGYTFFKLGPAFELDQLADATEQALRNRVFLPEKNQERYNDALGLYLRIFSEPALLTQYNAYFNLS